MYLGDRIFVSIVKISEEFIQKYIEQQGRGDS